MRSHKSGVHRYKGFKNREERKRKHMTRAEMESQMMALKSSKTLEFFVKDVNDDFTPTNYFIVEFNMKEKMSLEAFRNLVYLMVVGWI